MGSGFIVINIFMKNIIKLYFFRSKDFRYKHIQYGGASAARRRITLVEPEPHHADGAGALTGCVPAAPLTSVLLYFFPVGKLAVLRIRIRPAPDLIGRIRIRTSGTGSGS
jgi:hypothetical protein